MSLVRRWRGAPALALVLGFIAAFGSAAHAGVARVSELTVHPGDVPRRLVGYGLVTGLSGTGDRSFGGISGGTATVRSIVNLLRRFNIAVPANELRPRDVAAVLVTAEASPWLRAGGRFPVQVSTLGDAVSLRGGVLWVTPLVTDPNAPPLATAQGPLLVDGEEGVRTFYSRGANSARIPMGGLLEVDSPAPVTEAALLLRDPEWGRAMRIATAIDAAFGAGTARVEDAGRIALTARGNSPDSLAAFLAGVDTVSVTTLDPARIVIDGKEGTVVAGGDVRVGTAVVTHRGITLAIGPTGAPRGTPEPGVFAANAGATIVDVTAGLRAAGARPDEIAAILEALHAAGAIHAEVIVR